ncbi:MAG: pentapeptide repeat-containing protein, partial [Crocosphaera sp.]
YDADVTGASMDNLNITNAQIFNTVIGIGGEAP